MRHYAFAATRDEFLDAVNDMSYCVFTKPCDLGWIRGYAQGSHVPLGLTLKKASASSSVMRRAILELGQSTMEHGAYVTMGQCQACGTTASPSWSPHLCDRCLVCQ